MWLYIIDNPLRPVAISKLLELIGRSAYILTSSPATAPDSDINQTALPARECEKIMHATVCLLRAGQPRCTSNAAKSGQFRIGKFSGVIGDPMGVKGLNDY